MSTLSTWTHGLHTGFGSALSLLRIYLLAFTVSAGAATAWLVVIVTATEATGSALLVLALVALPGIVVMALSRHERAHWYEYALVWLLFFTAVPTYGVALLIGGYGLVLARAWRRRWPHSLQAHGD